MAENVAAVIIEPIQGEGGFVVPAPGFLPAIADWCAANGALLIADEIQTGFCRTGDWFACDHEGVVPDLVTTAKGIAGGLPLAAVTGRAEIMDARALRRARRHLRRQSRSPARPRWAPSRRCASSTSPAAAQAIESTMVDRLRSMQARHPT